MPEPGPTYKGGGNIALKLPPHLYEPMVAFYRDTLGMAVEREGPDSVSLAWGGGRLWLDRMPSLGSPEVWLEVITNDSAAASRHLASAGVPRQEAVEALPPGLEAFWINTPAGIVHLVAESDNDSAGD